MLLCAVQLGCVMVYGRLAMEECSDGNSLILCWGAITIEQCSVCGMLEELCSDVFLMLWRWWCIAVLYYYGGALLGAIWSCAEFIFPVWCYAMEWVINCVELVVWLLYVSMYLLSGRWTFCIAWWNSMVCWEMYLVINVWSFERCLCVYLFTLCPV